MNFVAATSKTAFKPRLAELTLRLGLFEDVFDRLQVFFWLVVDESLVSLDRLSGGVL